jgi:hypothetical protein
MTHAQSTGSHWQLTTLAYMNTLYEPSAKWNLKLSRGAMIVFLTPLMELSRKI